MKGIILAGGKGTRLNPMTSYMNKHLLPIYNKPMIYYPLALLLLCGIKDILIITNKEDIIFFKKLFNKKRYPKISFSFEIQNKPNGVAEAFNISKKFIQKSEKNILILGDNFFYGQKLPLLLKSILKKKKNHIFLYHVNNPKNFGNIEIKKGKIVKLDEKSNKIHNNLAITGLYIFNQKSLDNYNKLKKSKRGEFEVTDYFNLSNKINDLDFTILSRGITWLDMGTYENLLETSNFVRIIENRQGYKIADIDDILKEN